MLNSIKVGNFSKFLGHFVLSLSLSHTPTPDTNIPSTQHKQHEEKPSRSQYICGDPSQAMRLKSNVDVRIQIDSKLSEKFSFSFQTSSKRRDSTFYCYRVPPFFFLLLKGAQHCCWLQFDRRQKGICDVSFFSRARTKEVL